MSKTEPYIALGVAAVWGIYGLVYFMMRSRKNRPAGIDHRTAGTGMTGLAAARRAGLCFRFPNQPGPPGRR